MICSRCICPRLISRAVYPRGVLVCCVALQLLMVWRMTERLERGGETCVVKLRVRVIIRVLSERQRERGVEHMCLEWLRVVQSVG